MRARISPEPFDPCAELRRYEQQALADGARHGATVSFVGTMRDLNDAESVQAMVLEHYPQMTEKHLDKILAEAGSRWEILDALVIHRVGELHPREPIVLVAVWSAHRAAAFEACRYLIDELKTRAPFWKKERRRGGAQWVEHNTPGA